MPYYDITKERLRGASSTLGVKLARQAVRKNISVQELSRAVGATRQTVYRWFAGHVISPAYRSTVTQVLNIIAAAPNRDAAWSQLCATFPHLKP